MQLALDHHRAGRLPAAEQIYRQIVQQIPNVPEPLTYLSMALRGMGRAAEALLFAQRAVTLVPAAVEPRFALADALTDLRRFGEAAENYRVALASANTNIAAWLNLSYALQQLERYEESIEACRTALRLQPDSVEGHNNLAEALRLTGRTAEAVKHSREAVRLRPELPGVWFTLGNTLLADNQLDESIAALAEVTRRMPDFADGFNNLGAALMNAGRAEESIATFERAIALSPHDASKRVNLARALEFTGRFKEAFAIAESATAQNPNLAEAWNQLGVCLSKLDQPQKAIEAYRKAIACRGDFANPHSNLGNALREQGLIEEAIAERRRALELEPNHPHAWSNLLYTLHFHKEYDGPALLAEHRRWAELKADPLKPPLMQFTNDRSPQRRLRIGFVSPDLRRHAVATFLLPLLSNINHEQFHVTCYADVIKRDRMTEELQGNSDAWHFTTGLTHDALADQIRRDAIDILVDLSVHSSDNRMLLFARKPAPVQVTYLGYPSTTGLLTMDWRLTDRFLDPPDESRPFYTEKSAYLESTYWCYRPPEIDVALSDLPLAKNGHVTFGCFNSFAKVSDNALAAWGRILSEMPGSRLMLHSDPGDHHQRVFDAFGAHGIERDRFEFVPRAPLGIYFQRYQQIDIALDPFPYCGGTTTLDALWMGVPVVSLVGDVPVRRAGLSILSRIDLGDLAVDRVDAYVAKAIELAGDIERLKSLRSGLRDRMLHSPLMAAPAFARDVERVFRMMWTEWCESKPTPTSTQ